jgi:hypothetical protein
MGTSPYGLHGDACHWREYAPVATLMLELDLRAGGDPQGQPAGRIAANIAVR